MLKVHIDASGGRRRRSLSELDLSQPLTPPEEGAHDAVVLAARAAVPEVQPEQAVGLVAVPADKRSELAKRGQEFVSSLAAEQPQSPAFAKKVDDLVRMGAEEIRASAQVSNRMLERPSSSLAAAQGRGPVGDPQVRVARTLQDLRTTITDLDPARADLTGVHRLLGMIPGAKRLATYFQRYQSAQTQLNAIIDALTSGQD